MINPWTITGSLVVLIVTFIFGVGVGKKLCEEEHDSQQLEQLADDKKKVDIHDQVKAKEQVKTDAKIKVIYQTVDDCLSRPAPQSVIDSLRHK